jgi:hypothetical protein
MKAYGGMHHVFLISALVGREWSASRPDRFTPGGKVPGTHWIGDWVSLRTGLNYVEKRKFLTLPGLELRPLSRPARSQSLYRLSYPGSTRMVSTLDSVLLVVNIISNNRVYEGADHGDSSLPLVSP